MPSTQTQTQRSTLCFFDKARARSIDHMPGLNLWSIKAPFYTPILWILGLTQIFLPIVYQFLGSGSGGFTGMLCFAVLHTSFALSGREASVMLGQLYVFEGIRCVLPFLLACRFPKGTNLRWLVG
eukprot:g59339.t1